MLTDYASAEYLYDHTEDGRVRQPLALLFKHALEAPTSRERNLFLRRLGDIALLVAGLFSGSLRRSLVDVDYYISMGEAAYAHLSHAGKRPLGEVFAELSDKFASFVDVLGEVGEQAQGSKSQDILRMYELWSKTGSRRLERKLRALGMVPAISGLAH
jgi:hypothetical protein